MEIPSLATRLRKLEPSHVRLESTSWTLQPFMPVRSASYTALSPLDCNRLVTVILPLNIRHSF
jgi:hypothetical protein